MILIVQSEWNGKITKTLAQGAVDFFAEHHIETKWVKAPGALEIPLLTKWFWEKQHRSVHPLTGVVACGCVVRGDTFHFEIVATESARKLMDLSIELSLPIGHAILTVDQLSQAEDRSSGRFGNKGREAAEAVFRMIQLKKEWEAV